MKRGSPMSSDEEYEGIYKVEGVAHQMADMFISREQARCCSAGAVNNNNWYTRNNNEYSSYSTRTIVNSNLQSSSYSTDPSPYRRIYSSQNSSCSNYKSIYPTRTTSYAPQKSSYSSQSAYYPTRHANNSTNDIKKKSNVTETLSAQKVDEDAAEDSPETTDGKPEEHHFPSGQVETWDDLLLKMKEKSVNEKKKRKTFLWRPGSGRHVSEGSDSYRPFTHIGRVLHVDDAVEVCSKQRLKPKPVTAFSCIDHRELPPEHPCANLRVLWFGAKIKPAEEDRFCWYGNVEFEVDAQILLSQWKFWFLVEMMTTPTHTASRILVTNTDYSSVLPSYDRSIAGGPWRVGREGQQALVQCSRYQFKGTNVHDHVLEFMVEAKPDDERVILAASRITFRNHEKAKHGHIPHVCSRYQKEGKPCPTPFSESRAARHFFRMLRQRSVQVSRMLPTLTPEAQKELHWFEEDERRMAKQFTARRADH